MTHTAKRLNITLIDNICDPEKPGRSGHSDIVWEASRCLLGAGHAVTIVADYTTPTPFQHANLRVVTFKARAFDRRNGLGKIVHVLRAFRRARLEPADLLFTTDAFSAGVTSLCSQRTPVVFLTPANIYQRQASGYKLDPMASFCYRLVSYFAARRSAHIIATSRDLKGWWEKTGAAPERVSVIPLGIEAHQFGGKGETRRATTEPLRLLYVARFEGDNNPQLLVTLAQQLKAHGVPFTLTAVGDGTLLGRVKAEAAEAGLQDVLHFAGYRDYHALPALYAANDVFVFVREAGGPPRVVLQAMASGLAVVAFNSSGLEDYVVSGETGFLVQNGSVAQVAEAVAALSAERELLYEVQTAAQHAVRQSFSWSSVTARYMALFLSLLNAPRDPTQSPPERKTSHG